MVARPISLLNITCILIEDSMCSSSTYLVFSLCLLDDVLLRPSGARFPLSSNGETFGGFSGKSWRLRRSLDLFCFCCSNSHWVCNGRRACDLRMDELSTRFTVLCPILKNYIKYRTSYSCSYESVFSSVYTYLLM